MQCNKVSMVFNMVLIWFNRGFPKVLTCLQKVFVWFNRVLIGFA